MFRTSTYKGGYNTVKKIIEEGTIPDGFFVANDIMALGVIDALRENSYSKYRIILK